MTGGTPRITPLTEQELSDDARELLALPLKGHQLNAVSPFLLTLVRHAGLYRRYAPFAGKLLVGGKLPARDRELAILRGAWLCSGAYEWGEHVRLARAAGIGAAEIENVIVGPTAPAWSDHERAVLTAVDELRQGGHIGDETWNVLARQYDDLQLIELPMLIGAYQMIAYVQNSLRTSLPAGSAGLDAR